MGGRVSPQTLKEKGVILLNGPLSVKESSRHPPKKNGAPLFEPTGEKRGRQPLLLPNLGPMGPK